MSYNYDRTAITLLQAGNDQPQPKSDSLIVNIILIIYYLLTFDLIKTCNLFSELMYCKVLHITHIIEIFTIFRML